MCPRRRSNQKLDLLVNQYKVPEDEATADGV